MNEVPSEYDAHAELEAKAAQRREFLSHQGDKALLSAAAVIATPLIWPDLTEDIVWIVGLASFLGALGMYHKRKSKAPLGQ